MFQFTIRDLILITVIVALYVGWVADRHEKGARIEQLEAALEARRLAIITEY